MQSCCFSVKSEKCTPRTGFSRNFNFIICCGLYLYFCDSRKTHGEGYIFQVFPWWWEAWQNRGGPPLSSRRTVAVPSARQKKNWRSEVCADRAPQGDWHLKFQDPWPWALAFKSPAQYLSDISLCSSWGPTAPKIFGCHLVASSYCPKPKHTYIYIYTIYIFLMSCLVLHTDVSAQGLSRHERDLNTLLPGTKCFD